MSEWESIPGETPIDLSHLKIPGITTRRQLNAVEAANITKAVVKYLGGKPSRRTAPFDLDWCLRLHREMLGDVWDWAGTIRTRDLNIGVPFYIIQESLQNLLLDLQAWSDGGMDLVEQAARLHHRAVQIHPFENGNGRWSRLLANIWLRRHDYPVVVWPEETIGTVSIIRDAYLAAIHSADNGELKPLIDFFNRYVESRT